MRFPRFTPAIAIASLLPGASVSSLAQQAAPLRPQAAGTAQGQLTVTVTVVSSVGAIIGPDGQPRLFVANASDPADGQASLLAPDAAAAAASENSGKSMKQAAEPPALPRLGPGAGPEGNVTKLEDTKKFSKVFERFAAGAGERRLQSP